MDLAIDQYTLLRYRGIGIGKRHNVCCFLILFNSAINSTARDLY